MEPAATAVRPGYTARQGQYLAFIHAYWRLNGRAPAEADFQRFFRVSPPLGPARKQPIELSRGFEVGCRDLYVCR